MDMDRYSGARTSYGIDTFNKISNSHILVIGAGGIGCELLKNLVMFGFKNIDIVDLDTIDVSNLNRQFLFRSCNVGQSKALIAADIAQKFNNDVIIKPYHGNIKDTKFGVSFFKKFDLVLNALDNVDARRHVNRLCLASNKPLIDSGTTGYLGQVMPIIKNRTACYECQPKPTQKVYPICTIRSTPDKPVHCIVWSKELFKLLYNKTNESMLYEDNVSGTEGEESVDKSAYMHVVDLSDYWTSTGTPNTIAIVPTTTIATSILEIPWYNIILNKIQQLMIGVFTHDIEKRIGMDIYKTAKKTPVPIPETSINTAIQKCSKLFYAITNSTNTTNTTAATAATNTDTATNSNGKSSCIVEILHNAVVDLKSMTGLLGSYCSATNNTNNTNTTNTTNNTNTEWDSQVLCIEDVLIEMILLIFLVVVVNANANGNGSANGNGNGNDGNETDTPTKIDQYMEYKHYRSFYQLGLMEFDKDDSFAMRFVSLSSNLRMNIFHIPCINYHDCKGIAGNIIPAIPATNAIVAGIQVMQAIQLLKNGIEDAVCPLTYCLRKCTRKGVYLQPTAPDAPSSTCYVCNSSQINLQVW